MHGLEYRLRGEARPCRPEDHPALRRAVPGLERALRLIGALLEDKGCSVAVHWRLVPEHAEEVLVEPDMASAGSFRASVNEEKKHFDLWRANELVLRDAGVREERIEVSRLCTSCRTDLFYSHRAEKGNTGRFGGIVMLHEPMLESRDH